MIDHGHVARKYPTVFSRFYAAEHAMSPRRKAGMTR